MASRGTAVATRPSALGVRQRQHDLVGLVSRLMFAQAGASAAVSLSFSRRTLSSVLLAVLVGVALCGLAGLVRSGGHAIWLAAIAAESGFVAVGLYRFGYTRYLGGTLLGMITLGTMLHPAAARAFASRRAWGRSGELAGIAEPLMGEGSS